MAQGKLHKFPKAEKLKSRKQIDLLFREGKSFFAAPVKCYYRLTGWKVDKLGGLQVDVLGLQVDELSSQVDRLEGSEVDELSSQVDKLLGLQVYEEKGKWTNKLQTPNPHPDSYRIPTTNHKPQTTKQHPDGYRDQTTNHKPQTTNLKAGFTASKRNFKKATDRNRIKRLLREAYRIHKSPLQEKLQAQNKQLEVFFVFTDKALPKFDLIEEKMKYCIRRLGKIAEGGI